LTTNIYFFYIAVVQGWGYSALNKNEGFMTNSPKKPADIPGR